MLAALKRRHWQGVAVSGLAQLGMAIPAFWAGILLSIAFGVALGWLPPNGYVPLTTDPIGWARSLVLPVVSLALVQAAVLIRYVRSAFIEVLSEDYYRTARAVGWTQGRAMVRHGLRNASLSLVTVLGLQLASILVGAIVIEQVFVLPGLGSLLLTYVRQKDVMVIQGVVMLLVLAVAPMTLAGWVMGFVLFRFFDILKPWPIRWFDQRVEGGLGVMLDDLWAAGFAIVGLWFFAWLGVLTLAD